MAINHIGKLIVVNDKGNTAANIIQNEVKTPIIHANNINLIGNSNLLTLGTSRYVLDMVKKK